MKNISPYISTLDDANKGYKKLRNDALLALESNSLCARLARDYGGWSLEAIKLQIPVDKPNSIEDIAFWLVILLYNNLATAAFAYPYVDPSVAFPEQTQVIANFELCANTPCTFATTMQVARTVKLF